MTYRHAASCVSVVLVSISASWLTTATVRAGTPPWKSDANPGPVYPRAVDPNAGQPVAAPPNAGSQIRPAGNYSPNGPTGPYTPSVGAPANQLPLERQALGEQQTSAAQTPVAYAPGTGAGLGSTQIAAAPAAPFQLTPAEQQAVDALLQAWEQKQVKKFSATFTRWDYDFQYAPKEKEYQIREASGVIKYQAPDKGQFKVEKIKQLDTSKAKYEVDPVTKMSFCTNAAKLTFEEVPDAMEEWRCNGKSIFEFDYKKKQLIEHKLPPELQGKAIINSPLPFVFGAEAKKIKERYWVRIKQPPKDDTTHIWLEAVPRYQADAANYERVDIILNNQDFVPVGLQIYQPGGSNRQAYKFEPKTELFPDILTPDFSKPSTPFGWKSVVEDPSQSPPGGPDGNRDARRAPPSSNPTMRK